MKARKILIVTRIYHPEPAAAAFRLAALSAKFASAGYHVTVLTAAAGSVLPARRHGPANEGVHVWPFFSARGAGPRRILSVLSFDLPLIVRLMFRLTIARPDLVISEPPPTSGFVCAALGRVFRIPVLYFAADLWGEMFTPSKSRSRTALIGFFRAMEGLALRWSHGVVTVNDQLAGLIRLKYDASAEVVGNGIDLATYLQPQTRTRRPTLVYAGTLGVAQGADVLLDLAELLSLRNAPFNIHVYGEGADRQGLMDLARQKGLTNIEFLGAVSPEDVARELFSARAGLVVLREDPVFEAAMPTKIFAALACGTPVVFIGPDGIASQRIGQHNLGCATKRSNLEVIYDWLITTDGREPADLAARLSSWAVENGSLGALSQRVNDIADGLTRERPRS